MNQTILPCLLDKQQGNKSKQVSGQMEPPLHQLPNHIECKQPGVKSAIKSSDPN